MKKREMIGWALAILLTASCIFGIGRPNNDEELDSLEARISLLTDTIAARDDSIAGALDRARDAEAALEAVQVANTENINQADEQEAPRIHEFEVLIADDPILVAGFDSVKVSYERRIAVRDSTIASERRQMVRVKAENKSAIGLLQRQLNTALERSDDFERERDIYKAEARPSFAIKLFRGAGRIVSASAGAYIGQQVASQSDMAPAFGAAGGLILYEALK